VNKPAVVVLDSDPARRNALVRLLYVSAWHVEPYESFAELQAFLPSGSIVIAHDDDAIPRKIFDLLLERGTWRPIVFYAGDPDPSRIVDVILMGAMDYLRWPFASALLNERLRLLLERQSSVAELRQKASRSKKLIATLTQREREVLFFLAQGASNKSIAQQLRLSPRTIEIHRGNMMSKLGVKHVGEAISIALYADMSGPRGDDESFDGYLFDR
jgi:FixJ family two-component response regulator